MFTRQTFRFALAGLLGALAAALVVELLVIPLLPKPPQTSKPVPVDIAFIVDCSGSMIEEIEGVKSGLDGFVSSMNSQVGANGEKLSIDWRVGFLTIGDSTPTYRQVSLGTQFLSNDTSLLKKAIEPIQPNQGGTEYCFDAMNATCNPGYFRDDAQKVLIMIGDEGPQGTIPENGVIKAMEDRGISQLHFVVGVPDRAGYEKLRGSKPIPGESEDIAMVNDASAFSRLMPKLAGNIGKNIPPDLFQAGTGSGGGNNFTLAGLFKVVLVSALIAAGIALALISVQKAHQGYGYFLSAKQLLYGGGGGVLAGAIAGAAAQSGFAVVSSSLPLWLPTFLGWAILGGLVGGALKFFVPNLGFSRGIIGGLIGGGIGGILFLQLDDTSGMVGRLLGFMAMGFCIGLMVAVALQMLRDFWLEVYYSKDKITKRFPLGGEPISIGSENCTLYAQGPPVSFRYRVADGKALKQTGGQNPYSEVSQGDTETVGALQLKVVAQAAAADGRQVPSSSKGASFEAEIVANPSNPNVLGVKNNGATPWDVQIPGSGSSVIQPGKSLKLVAGTQIAVGGRPTLEINHSPKDPLAFGLKNLTTGRISCTSPLTSKDLSAGESMKIHAGLKMKS